MQPGTAVYSQLQPCTSKCCLEQQSTAWYSQFTESEKAGWRVGIANRKVFARPESFCAYILNGPWIKSKHSILSVKFLIRLESFRTVCKVSDQSGKFPDSLKSFRIVWKVSIPSESFWTVWKVSGQWRRFPNSLDSFPTIWRKKKILTVWNVSGQSEKFLKSLESFRIVYKDSRQSE